MQFQLFFLFFICNLVLVMVIFTAIQGPGIFCDALRRRNARARECSDIVALVLRTEFERAEPCVSITTTPWHHAALPRGPELAEIVTERRAEVEVWVVSDHSCVRKYHVFGQVIPALPHSDAYNPNMSVYSA